MSEVGSADEMEAAITKMAESQTRLGQVMEWFLTVAEEDRGKFQEALAGQSQAQGTVLDKLTDILGQQRTPSHLPSVVLQKYTAGEDPDFFFTNFERMAQAASWPADRWGHYLGPLLSGELQAAYQASNIQGTTPYADIKWCILERLGIDDETYRVKLRQLREGPQETPRALYFHVKDLADHWLKPASATKEEIMAKIYLEQFLASLHPPIQRWVRQHAHLTLETAVDIATAFCRAQEIQKAKEEVQWRQGHSGSHRPSRPPPPKKQEPVTLLPGAPPTYRAPVQGPQCYNCGGMGHIARVCPHREEPMDVSFIRNYVCLKPGRKPPYRCRITVNGQPVQAVADTGCRQSVLRPQELENGTGPVTGTVAIQCVHGDSKVYPTTQVRIGHDPDEDTSLTVGLIPKLPEQAILGTDYPHLPKLLQEATSEDSQWYKDAPFYNDDEHEWVEESKRKAGTRRDRKKIAITPSIP